MMEGASQDTEPTMQTKTRKIFSQEGLFWVGGVHMGQKTRDCVSSNDVTKS